MIYLLEGYFTIVVELFILKIFFDTFIKNQEISLPRTLFIFFLLSVLDFIGSVLLSDYFIAKEFVIIFLTYCCMRLYTNGLWRKVITLTVLYQGILLIADFITLILKSVFFNETDISQGSAGVLLIVLDKTVVFLLVIILKSIFRNREFAVLKDKDWSKFIFFPLFTICMILAMLSLESYEISNRLKEFFLCISVGLIAINIL